MFHIPVFIPNMLSLTKIPNSDDNIVEYAVGSDQRALPGNATSSNKNDRFIIWSNPSSPDEKGDGGGEGSQKPNLTGSCLQDYPRRETMHTT
jgi:hypothetical protein